MHEFIVHLKGLNAPAAVGNKARRRALPCPPTRVARPPTHVCTWTCYLNISRTIHALIAALTTELQHKIDLVRTYAVRSSANIEDGLTYSFAGQSKAC